MIMIELLEIIGFLVAGIILYVFIGYPLLLFVLNKTLPKRRLKRYPITPTVSFFISCYNEESVIREKLNNALQMDYPQDKIEIVVISDCSTDRTDEIVQSFNAPNIRLLRMDDRKGKTMGINYAVEQTQSDVIVFSDANAMYEKDAVRKLVRNFSDEKVGYVVGEARYLKKGDGASISEQTYWSYECSIKKIESRIHSVVGGDGAIYAIRRELYETLKESDINDFVNPLQIIAKGHRGIYEAEAVCWEEAAGSFKKEFNRKSRIVNRSFSGLLRVPSVLNPFKVGLFSFEVISHKLLRWLTPFFLIVLLLVSMGLAACDFMMFKFLLSMGLLLIILAYIGYLREPLLKNFIFYYPYYFMAVNIASVMGIVKRLKGHTDVTWNTVRTDSDMEQSNKIEQKYWIHSGMFILMVSSIIILLPHSSGNTLETLLKFFFWFLFYAIIYIYIGYPLVLLIWSSIRPNQINKGEIWPEVALLICAYNEEEVIREKIKNSLDIDYPHEKISIILASDGSSDKTVEIIKEYPDKRIRLFDYKERSGKIGAIIKTIPEITAEIVVFSDANAMIDKNAIQCIVRNFHDPKVGCVTADVIVQNEKTVYGRSESLYYLYERWIQKRESSINSVVGVDGGLYAIRRKLYIEPSPDIILDDFVISINTTHRGHRLVYDEDAKGFEESENAYKTEFSKKSRVVAGAFQALLRKEGLPPLQKKQMIFSYISHKFLRWLTPIFLVSLYVVTLSLMNLTGNRYLIAFFICQTMFYILAVFGLFYRNPIKIPLIHVPFYFCLVNIAALYGMYKGLLNKQSVKWQVFKRKQGA